MRPTVSWPVFDESAMVHKDHGVIETAHNDNVLPIEEIMYGDEKRYNEEAVAAIQAERDAGDLGDGFDHKRDRRLLWKIDVRVIPMLAVIYGMSVIDR
jgi:hypothetical protein